MVQYRSLKEEEIERELFQNFIRHQVVTDCWRREKGEWVVKSDLFTDDWSEEDYRTLIVCLKNTVRTGGLVYGAFCDGKLKGFTSVEPDFFGGEQKYLDLSSIHVSEDMRGRGIGKNLFHAAMAWAGKRGARKLYISAHSAVESQAFYKAMGCVEAQVYNQRHVEAEPFDCQLECRLPKRRDIGKLSASYRVRELMEADAGAACELAKGNPLFYQHCPPFVTKEGILSDMQALPPGKTWEDKFYVGFFQGEKLTAIMDLIFGYPNEDRAFIGFFMVDRQVQGKGTGSQIIKEAEVFLKEEGFCAIRLCYAKGNPQSRTFWQKNVFKETGVESDHGEYTAVAMEKEI